MRAISSSRAAGAQHLDARCAACSPSPSLDHAPVGVGAGGDLRAVGDHQHLGLAGQPLQPQADRVGHRAADALVDLVEDHQRLRPAAARRPAPPSAPGRSGPARRPRRWRPGRRTARRDWWRPRTRPGRRRRARRGPRPAARRRRGSAPCPASAAPVRPRPPWPAGRRRRGGRRSGPGRRRDRPSRAAAAAASAAFSASSAVSIAAQALGESRTRVGRQVVDRRRRSLRAMARRANSRSSAFSSSLGLEVEGRRRRRRWRRRASVGLDQRAVDGRGRLGDQRSAALALGADAGLHGPFPRPLQRPQRLAEPAATGRRRKASRAAAMSARAFSAAPSSARSLGQRGLLALARDRAGRVRPGAGSAPRPRRPSARRRRPQGLRPFARRAPGAPGRGAGRGSRRRRPPKASSSGRWVRASSRPTVSCWPCTSSSSAPRSRSTPTLVGLVVDEGAGAAVGAELRGAAPGPRRGRRPGPCRPDRPRPGGRRRARRWRWPRPGPRRGAPARRRPARRWPGPGRRG